MGGTQRVLVIGGSGAGKTTAAVRLAAVLDLPLYHLDRLFWQPGWRELPRNQFDDALAQVVARPTWVIDGNFSRTLPQRLQAADTVLWLDFSTATCLAGVLARWAALRGRQRPDMGPGCPEKIDLPFLWYVMTWRARSRAPLARQLAEAGARGVAVHRVRSRRELGRWLACAVAPAGARHGA